MEKKQVAESGTDLLLSLFTCPQGPKMRCKDWRSFL